MKTKFMIFLAIILIFQGIVVLLGHIRAPEGFQKLAAWQKLLGRTFGKILHISVCGLFPLLAGILLILRALGYLNLSLS